MKKLILFCTPFSLALASCGVPSAPVNNAATNAATTAVVGVTNQVVLKATTALSLGELAFTSAEQTATAAMRVQGVSMPTKLAIAKQVVIARGYRDQARLAVQTGYDASAQLTALSGAISGIYNLTSKVK